MQVQIDGIEANMHKGRILSLVSPGFDYVDKKIYIM